MKSLQWHTENFGGDISEAQALKYARELAILYRSEKEKRFQLENVIKELERSNKELEDFAFIASHDLQEPLRKVICFADRMKIVEDSLNDRSRDCLDRMQKAAQRMQQCIYDLLQYSQVIQENPDIKHTDSKKIILEVIKELEVLLKTTQGEINVNDLPAVRVSESHMKQLFMNLLSNSLKFHRDNEKPRVEISARSVNDDFCEISVADNGIGFDEKYLDRIFKPFQRLNERSRYDGTGMGLAICKKIVDRYGGTIDARSLPEKGCIFLIALPVQSGEYRAQGTGPFETHP